MKSNNRYKGLNNFTIHTVRRKAKELSSNHYFSIYDQEDIEQELLTYLLTRLPTHDFLYKHSQAGIIKKLVDERAIQLKRAVFAQKRGSKCFINSLNDLVEVSIDESPKQFERDIPATATFYQESGYKIDVVECQIDVQRTLQKMPPTRGELLLGELCELLQQMTVTEISKIKGVSRETVYQAILKIRHLFLESGLKIYIRP